METTRFEWYYPDNIARLIVWSVIQKEETLPLRTRLGYYEHCLENRIHPLHLEQYRLGIFRPWNQGRS